MYLTNFKQQRTSLCVAATRSQKVGAEKKSIYQDIL